MSKPLSAFHCMAIAGISLLGASTSPGYSLAADGTGRTVKTADSALSCDQIAHEVVELDQIIRDARQRQESSDNAGTGISVAKTVGSLLVGSLGGVVGIVAVGALAGEAAEESGEDAADLEEKAEERQNRLAGIYEGKGCEGELAMTADKLLTTDNDDIARLEPASGTVPPVKNPRPRYND